MKYGDTEFHELSIQFERDMKNSSIYVTDFKRVNWETRDRIPKDQFYDNGKTNELFHAHMLGYSFARSVANSERVGVIHD